VSADERFSPDAAPGIGESDQGPTKTVGSDEPAGAVIGRYHLLQKIGEGGMGEVWLADQKEPVRRRVALKLVKAGMNTREVIARFESERQALALMDHPTIAKVFDAGTTPQGAPYFVMEYVAGVPVTTYCDTHKFSTRERLELFMRVCEGVQHAHQKAIIHRDLKPSNILVTEVDGKAAPKIIDFGVAKALTQRLIPDTIFTRVGAMIGTPEYMSPEQAVSAGEDIDTRTDVYSLGIVLYELLAGGPPIDLRGIAFSEFQRRLREEEPRKPSTRIRTQDPATSTEVARKRQAEPLALARQMRGDLDSIALKALEKERSRRYGSPGELSADIGRYLRHEAVTAVPPSATYRAMKFVRRHRIGVASTVALAVTLITGVAVSLHEARVADRRFNQVRELANTFLFQLYDQVTPLPGSTAVRASIVETARKYLDGLSREAGNDKGLILELAEAYQRLGDVQGRVGNANLGQVEEARRSYQQALELYSRLPVNAGSPPDLRRRLASALWSLGRLEYSVYREDAAELATRRMLDLLGDRNPDPQTRMLRVRGERSLGQILTKQGRSAEAVSFLESAHQSLLDLSSSGFRDPNLPNEINNAKENLARAKVFTGDLDGALSLFQDLLRSSEPCNEHDPPGSACRTLAVRLSSTADVYAALDRPNLGEPEKAAPLYQQALQIQERLAALDARDRQARFDLAARCGKLGDTIWQSNPKRALELYERALATARDLTSKEQFEILQGAYLIAIARPLIRLGRLADARKALTESLHLAKVDARSPYADRMGEILDRMILPQLLLAEGKSSEAQQTLEQIIKDIQALRSEKPADFTPVFLLSDCYRQLASITKDPEQRRQAFMNSAAAWHAWPSTSFTVREEQKDLMRAHR